METKTHEFLRQHQLQEVSVLELIRVGIDKDDIVSTVVDLYRKKQVVTSYGGSYPIHAYTIGIHPTVWEEYVKGRGNIWMREMYRRKLKKKEIELVREIMWKLVAELFPNKLNDNMERSSYTHPATWTFVRTTREFDKNDPLCSL
jgi:hypothetical protein